MRKPRILAFAGSIRKDSFNKKLIRIAARAAQECGTEVTIVDLKDFSMPMFDEDLEKAQGQPEAAVRLKKLMVGHDGFLIASPEYNSSITPVLKNSIDWVSRPVPNETPLIAFKGKAAMLMSASPGPLGGLRGLVHIRSILGNIGMIVLPDQVAVPNAFEAYTAEGALQDPHKQAGIEGLGRTLAVFLQKHVA